MRAQKLLLLAGVLMVLCAGIPAVAAEGNPPAPCIMVSGAPPIKLDGFKSDEYEQKLNHSDESRWKTWRELLYSLHQTVSQEFLAPWFPVRFSKPEEAAKASCPLNVDVTLSYHNLKGSLMSPLERTATFVFKNASGKEVWRKTVDAGTMSPSIFKKTMRSRTQEGIEIVYRRLVTALGTGAADIWDSLAEGGEGQLAWLGDVQKRLQANAQQVSSEIPPYLMRGLASLGAEALIPRGDPLSFAREIEERMPATASPRPRHYAVVVGIGEYRNAKPVPYAVHDAQRMKVMLANAVGVPQKNIFLLADRPTTRRQWKRTLTKRLKGQIRDGDVLWFYYTGRWTRRGEETYLMAYDADPETGKGFYALNRLVEELQALDAERVVLILDAVPGPSFGGEEDKSIPPSGREDEEERVAIFMLEEEEHPFGLNPSKTLYLGMLAPRERHGRSSLFTYALAEGLQGVADWDGDGLVTAQELYEHAEARLLLAAHGEPSESDGLRPTLYPSEGKAAEFAVVQKKGGGGE